jgi:transcriptional regulator with XRE-family HTH domain
MGRCSSEERRSVRKSSIHSRLVWGGVPEALVRTRRSAYVTSQVTQGMSMPALPAVAIDPAKPVLLAVGRDLVRRAMRRRGLTVAALAAELGISRKHLSHILNGHAPLVEPLAHRLAEAAQVDPVLLGATIRPPRRAAPTRHGGLKGWIVAHGDLTEPMESWEMLED